MKDKEIKNIVDLRQDLTQLYQDIKDDAVEPEKAAALTNCAGKIISSVRVQLEYAAQQEKAIDVDFLETGKLINGPKTKGK